MAAEAIHVDIGDEVPAIVERIRRSPADEVQLVLPPRARFGQSRFNFQLLKQYSTRLGKRVAIWSPDPAVQRLAEESGFHGFRPEPGAPAPQPQTRMPAQRQGPFPADAAGAVSPYAAPAPAGRPGPPRQPVGTSRIRVGAVGRRLPGQITQFQPARYALYGGAILVLLAGILAVLFYVPTARVTLVAQAQPFSTPVDLTADTTAKSPVHVRALTLSSQSDSRPFSATGVKMVGGQQATGQFTYVNSCPFALQIASGQRLHTAGGVVFAQLGDAAVEQGRQQTVSIKAVQPGLAGNVGAGQINGIDNNTFTCLGGGNLQATTGGAEDQKQTVIQSSDVQSAKASLESDLRQKIIDQLQKNVQKGETLAGQPQFTNETFNTTHNVDDNVPSFTATLTLNAEGDYYSADDVGRAFTGKLASKVPSGQQLTTNKVTPTYTVSGAPGGHLEFNGSANGYIAPTIDIQQIKRQLAGKSAAQAHDMLTRLPIQSSVIDQSPPLPLMPLSASRITIEYGVEAQTPGRSS
jgi:hypothetical protein